MFIAPFFVFQMATKKGVCIIACVLL